SGASVVVTPTGGSALAAVTTNATGQYSRGSVPVPPATGNIAVSNLPTGCTAPAPTPYSGLTANNTVTVNITVTCSTAAVTSPVTYAWGPITATGPTGRQTTLTISIDMGPAPGLPNVNGSGADDLAAIQLSIALNQNLLTFASRLALDPN